MEGKEIKGKKKKKREAAARHDAARGEGIKSRDDAKGVETGDGRQKAMGGRVELVRGNRYKRRTKDGDSAEQRATRSD